MKRFERAVCNVPKNVRRGMVTRGRQTVSRLEPRTYLLATTFLTKFGDWHKHTANEQQGTQNTILYILHGGIIWCFWC